MTDVLGHADESVSPLRHKYLFTDERRSFSHHIDNLEPVKLRVSFGWLVDLLMMMMGDVFVFGEGYLSGHESFSLMGTGAKEITYQES